MHTPSSISLMPETYAESLRLVPRHPAEPVRGPRDKDFANFTAPKHTMLTEMAMDRIALDFIQDKNYTFHQRPELCDVADYCAGMGLSHMGIVTIRQRITEFAGTAGAASSISCPGGCSKPSNDGDYCARCKEEVIALVAMNTNREVWRTLPRSQAGMGLSRGQQRVIAAFVGALAALVFAAVHLCRS